MSAREIPVLDEQRANLFHELVLSNRIVENLMKGVNEVHGEKAAEQVLQNFLRKGQGNEKVTFDEEVKSPQNTEKQNVEQYNNSRLELERLARRLPKSVANFTQLHATAFGGPSSVPKNRQSNSSAVNTGEEVLEAVEQIAVVAENLTKICGGSGQSTS